MQWGCSRPLLLCSWRPAWVRAWTLLCCPAPGEMPPPLAVTDAPPPARVRTRRTVPPVACRNYTLRSDLVMIDRWCRGGHAQFFSPGSLNLPPLCRRGEVLPLHAVAFLPCSYSQNKQTKKYGFFTALVPGDS
jgi:hypothetical protein